MKLVIIYGPPAVGKLTVAKELSKLTGFKLLHNHLTFDLAKILFEFGTPEFFALSKKMRLQLFEAAAAHGVKGLIFTFCYAAPWDDSFIRQIMRIIKKHDGDVLFVQLDCTDDELHHRVKEASRKAHAKVTTVKGLEWSLKKWGLRSPIPFVKSLRIDTTNKKPLATAKLITTHYRL